MRILLQLLFAFVALSNASGQDIWKVVYPDSIKLYYAPTRDTVYVIEGFDLMRTTDACATWEKIGAIPWLNDTILNPELRINHFIEDLHFMSADVAILSGYSIVTSSTTQSDPVSKLYITKDRGQSWDTSTFSFSSGGKGTAPITKFSRVSDDYVFGFGGVRVNNSGSDTMRHSCIIFDGETVKNYPTPMAMVDDAATLGTELTFVGQGKAMIGEFLGSSFRTVFGRQAPVVYINRHFIFTASHRSTDNGQTWDSLSITFEELYGSDATVLWGRSGARWYKTSPKHHGWPTWIYDPELYKITTFDTSFAYAMTGRNGYLRRTTSGGFPSAVTRASREHTPIWPNPAKDYLYSARELSWFDLPGRKYEVRREPVGEGYQYDVRELNRGVYIVRFEGGSQMVVVE